MTSTSEAELPPADLAAAERMWNEYCAALPGARPSEYVVDYFGDHPALCDTLLAEVIAGRKRATASLESEYAQAQEGLPEVGSHWIACDSTGTPRLIVRTTAVSLRAFDQVDGPFAAAEGEDDRTLASWRREHERYWRRTERAAGRDWTPQDTQRPGHRVVCEYFEVVWPRNGA